MNFIFCRHSKHILLFSIVPTSVTSAGTSYTDLFVLPFQYYIISLKSKTRAVNFAFCDYYIYVEFALVSAKLRKGAVLGYCDLMLNFVNRITARNAEV